MARKLIVETLPVLQTFAVEFLAEFAAGKRSSMTTKFPAERVALEKEAGKPCVAFAQQREEWFGDFFQIKLATALERFDWVNQPAQFVEQLSSHLGLRTAGRVRKAAPRIPLVGWCALCRR